MHYWKHISRSDFGFDLFSAATSICTGIVGINLQVRAV